MRVPFSAALFAAASLAGLAACHAQAPAPSQPAPSSSAIEAPKQVAARTVPLTIRTAKGERAFRVEVARTPAEQERGLMFRRGARARRGHDLPDGAAA